MRRSGGCGGGVEDVTEEEDVEDMEERDEEEIKQILTLTTDGTKCQPVSLVLASEVDRKLAVL